MAKVKIISNPYENTIEYQKWDGAKKKWTGITNEDSKLRKATMSNAVFPFQVKKILDVICEEFQAKSEKIELFFEGTPDEYQTLRETLRDVCTEKAYRHITLHKLERALRNARDILPEVTKIFTEKIQPLIDRSVRDDSSLRKDREQFADVSKEAIPICVVGTYSSGKSTFINALIGAEILPSGPQPLTARIHKIENSRQPDRASIKFNYQDEPITIQFQGNDAVKISKFSDEPLISELNRTLAETGSLAMRVERILSILNKKDNADNADGVDDEDSPQKSPIGSLIEITFPFNREGVFGQSRNTYVVFDTPGSNSATNTSHIKVLQEAMQNLSNGLPIYVSTYQQLDTTNNLELCDMIKSMERLDSRYTMIVVNKADDGELPDPPSETKNHVLKTKLARSLYAGGIYFVSSIMGLGGKNGGSFINNFYKKTYKTKMNCYKINCCLDDEDSETTQPDPPRYEYNVLPEHLQKKAVEESQNCGNRIFADSGLFCIEQEIETFASKYSPYNKCWQSLLFLNSAIHITEEQIVEKQGQLQKQKEIWDAALDKKQRELKNTLASESKTMQEYACDNFPSAMQPVSDGLQPSLTNDDLKDVEEKIAQAIREQTDSAGTQESAPQVEPADQPDGANSDDIFAAAKNFGNDIRTFAQDLVTRQKNNWDTKNKVANSLLETVVEWFDMDITAAQEELNRASIDYWRDNSEKIKEQLAQTVTESTALSEEQREQLAAVIRNYDIVSFNKQAKAIFVKKNFLGLLDLFRWQMLRTYSSEFRKGTKSIFDRIQEDHGEIFRAWNVDLLNQIEKNIIAFNPELRNYQQFSDGNQRDIKILEEQRTLLRQYVWEIEEKMAWSSIEE